MVLPQDFRGEFAEVNSSLKQQCRKDKCENSIQKLFSLERTIVLFKIAIWIEERRILAGIAAKLIAINRRVTILIYELKMLQH